MPFSGFAPDAFAFYAELEQNQNREWWLENKKRYESVVREPAERLAEELEDEFGPLKIFRPYKDVRFSADKRPYKDHLGLVSADSTGPAYYLQLSSAGLMLAGGLHQPDRAQLARFRELVDEPARAATVEKLIDDLDGAGFGLAADGSLATAPRGYRADHPRIALLRLTRFAVMRAHPIAEWMHSHTLIERVRSDWGTVRGWNEWLGASLPPRVSPS
ncbi:MAG: DUF2461 domain-containing protein [Microbacterium hominis]|jgi:uncharacterized protein (TIGR02453 family)|uniref:DUF2461 domain-containing protein n=1 Tax=Microbacterium aurum TaxID=36805 RepID=UPI000DB5ECC0|nr:DUF2461 domain-containing protein [Microbacterium aurum]MBZ6372749.1 DUF2461 domain-containing protein [Microbacterium hominis]PZU43561.1 MAG: TIGR02453 family protein [Microbacterium sp.]